ncbi:MAG: hypothetical protein ACRDFW_05870 [bacterium]
MSQCLDERLVLELVEAGVQVAATEQLLVGPFLADPSLVDDEDPVNELDGGETMGDDQRGPPAATYDAAVADGGSNVIG